MGKVLKFMIALLLCAGGLVIALVLGWNYLDSSPRSESADPVLFEVTDGATVSMIAEDLQQRNIIRSSFFFVALSRLQNTQGQMKTGMYRIRPQLTSSGIHDMMVIGSQKLLKITIPEGLTARKIGLRLEEEEICSQDDFLSAVHSGEIVSEYGIPADSLEGYLFPDTYLFQQKYPAEKIVRHLVDTFFEQLGEIAPKYDRLKPEELHEKIILASIIEREYRDPDETGKIASVFYNRLERNMRLQSCATVVYALTEVMGREHPNVLTYADLDVDSQFNTYQIWGLPPAPISNPGIYAIEGAFHPADTEYLYFLLMDPDAGKHVFSADLESHNNAYRLYIKK